MGVLSLEGIFGNLVKTLDCVVRLLYCCCGVIKKARFSTMAKRKKKQKKQYLSLKEIEAKWKRLK